MPRNVDLNLIRPLQALLEEKSVTRAADRLGLSQSAMSTSLAKLRRHFGDELLVRNGNAYEPSPLARELLEPVYTALRAVDRVFDRESAFDPSTSAREFSVIMSDYSAAVLGPAVSRMVAEQSPASRLSIHMLNPLLAGTAAETMRIHDLMLIPHGFVHGLSHRDLHEDEWACIVSSDLDLPHGRLTAEDLIELPWVTVYSGPTAFTTAVQQLRMQGIEPHVEVITESYMLLGPIIAGTRRVALVQERLGRLLETTGLVRLLDCPFSADPLVETMWWHPMYDSDKAHLWLRGIFIQAGIDIT
ncbi:LysR family transcriptional regulator [Actinoplanes sp. NPDC051470]|uniref:LysR family transcriptional regulator n=1 Tax=unclassified Actinoplanes TaxID=2626549 RepID=UPI00344505D7